MLSFVQRKLELVDYRHLPNSKGSPHVLSLHGDMTQQTTGIQCPACALFAESVKGIRGPYWRERAGKRRSYKARGVIHSNTVSVSPQFHELLTDACGQWIAHLKGYCTAADSDLALREHLSTLLPTSGRWLIKLLRPVLEEEQSGEAYFSGAIGPEHTATQAAIVAAELLGVGVRSLYRGKQ